MKASAKKNEDELFELVEQIKYNDKYIKELCVGESIQYILASDDQLFDLERQVTNPVSFSVLSFDPTFKLGEFYVTTSTYENQFLCHRSGTMAGKHPFFCWTCVCASLYEFRIVLLLLFYSSENTIWIEKHPSYWIWRRDRLAKCNSGRMARFYQAPVFSTQKRKHQKSPTKKL